MTFPSGYYAVEIHDKDYQHVGWHLIEKSKRGKIRRTARPANGAGMDALIAALDHERQEYGRGYELDYLSDPELQGPARETFGRLMGRCGSCGRPLTDPESKMRGIGPECWKGAKR